MRLILALLALLVSAPALAQDEAIVVHVRGMVCDFCAQALEKVFAKEAAVEGVAIDLSAETVTLTPAPGAAPITDARIEELVTWGGYDVESIERGTAGPRPSGASALWPSRP
ncbi:MAG TPA: hypothetical protein DDX54_02500 [Rhodospirillaceae bacterium]|jgi:copper chaperone CopZ|nr:heavy-metal-associated domain-containing protein [Alphaproteobacteria bacterium]HBH26255.1 hypothetical protein [Rhodospirillaceae bacterium]